MIDKIKTIYVIDDIYDVYVRAYTKEISDSNSRDIDNPTISVLVEKMDNAYQFSFRTYNDTGKDVSKISIVNGNKMLASHIIYDQDGRVLSSRRSNGWFETFKYDTNGNIIEHKDSEGKNDKFSYDSNSRCIYSDTSAGVVETRYDESGHMIWYKSSYDEWWATYVDDKITSKIEKSGNTIFWEYDEYGSVIEIRTSSPNIREHVKTFKLINL